MKKTALNLEAIKRSYKGYNASEAASAKENLQESRPEGKHYMNFDNIIQLSLSLRLK